MNPINFAARVLRDLTAASAGDAPAVTDPAPGPEPARVPVSYRLEPMYATAFESGFRRSAADEALVLEALAVETARVDSSWDAARTLFAPNTPCAGLYATQTPEPCPSRVSVPPDAQKPAQSLPAQLSKETT